MTDPDRRPDPLAVAAPGGAADGAGSVDDPLAQGRALLARALERRAAGHGAEGAELAGRAVAALHRADRSVAAARAQRLAADCLADVDHHEDALALLKRARRAFVADDPQGPDSAGCEVAAARSLRAIGRTVEAARALHRAEQAYRAAGMPVRAAVCALDRAVLLHDEGEAAEAVELLARARATFLDHRRPDLAAVSDFDLGVALLDNGQADDAIERLQSARGIFASLDRQADEAACDLNMGVALHAVGRTDEARHALRRARATFRDLGRGRDAEQAEHDLDVLDGLVDPDTAELSVLRDLGEVPPEVGDLAARLPAAAPPSSPVEAVPALEPARSDAGGDGGDADLTLPGLRPDPPRP